MRSTIVRKHGVRSRVIPDDTTRPYERPSKEFSRSKIFCKEPPTVPGLAAIELRKTDCKLRTRFIEDGSPPVLRRRQTGSLITRMSETQIALQRETSPVKILRQGGQPDSYRRPERYSPNESRDFYGERSIITSSVPLTGSIEPREIFNVFSFLFRRRVHRCTRSATETTRVN